MKFLRRQRQNPKNAAYLFQISPREKEWLVATLKLYPVLDAGYHQISKNKKTAKAEQQLLEDSMAEQKRELRGKLDKFLQTPGRFASDNEDGDLRFTVTAEQCEWLLQILNDVRVGSWAKLGQPEMEKAPALAVNPDQARLVAAMEMSGYFQMALLQAFK